MYFVVIERKKKKHLVSCTNTHHDVTGLVNHGMVKNTKTGISGGQDISIKQKILVTCVSNNTFGEVIVL